jgi:hypothetical protein
MTDNTGTCDITNSEGAPFFLTINHHTLITDSVSPIGSGGNLAKGAGFRLQQYFANSIFLTGTAAAQKGGWFLASIGGSTEGSCGSGSGWTGATAGTNNCTETFNYDMTSSSFFKLVWPGRSSSYYTEVGNNPNYPDTVLGACSPPACLSTPSASTGMYFPLTSYCTGSSPSYSGPGTGCVGFNGAMNTSSMPLTLADWHQYKLLPGGPFTLAGSDGQDLGAIFTGTGSIDYWETLVTAFPCPYSCGSPGPFPYSTSVAPTPQPYAPTAIPMFARKGKEDQWESRPSLRY